MSLARQILLDSPAGYWPLDELSGTTVFDRSGNERNGTVVGSGVTPHAGGPAGLRAMAFNGAASTYLSWAYNAAFDTHAGASGLFTYEVWVYRSVTGPKAIFSRGQSNNDYEILSQATATDTYNHQMLTPAGADVMNVASAGTSPLNAWSHVAMVYDRAAQLLIIYVNGIEVARDTTASGTTAATGGGHYLGSRHDALGDATYAWNGRMAQFAIFPTALSAARIKAHYEAGIRSGVVAGPGTYGGSAYSTVPYGGGTGNQAPPITPAYGSGTSTADFTTTAAGVIKNFATATSTATITTTATAKHAISGTAWVADQTQGMTVNISTIAMGKVDVPVVIPTIYVSTRMLIQRVSLTMPNPTLNSRGQPT